MRRLSTFFNDFRVLLVEGLLIDIFSVEECGITGIGHTHFLEHLTDDNLDVFVVNVYPLEAIDFLDLVHEVFLEFAHAADIENLLTAHGLMDDYNQRPRYQRNDYLGWVARAKQPATRQKRINQMLDELRAGGVYMNMEHAPSRKA